MRFEAGRLKFRKRGTALQPQRASVAGVLGLRLSTNRSGNEHPPEALLMAGCRLQTLRPGTQAGNLFYVALIR
jgi:hypothetical protein